MTNLTPAAQAAQDKARSTDGTFGAQILTKHEEVVASEIVPPTGPTATAAGELITVTAVDGRIFEFEATGFREPYEGMEPSAKVQDDGTIRLSWAVADEVGTPYTFIEGDTFETFDSEYARDAYVAQQKADGIPAANIFIVDKYDHSSVHYSVKDTADYPDRQWDVAPSGVLVLDGKGETGATISVESANAVLADYTNYCNGDVYGIASVTLDADGEEVAGSDEEVWGFIGSDYAQQAVNEGGY